MNNKMGLINLAVIGFFALVLAGFVILETAPFAKYFLILVGLVLLYLFIRLKKIDLLVFFSQFLFIFDIYNLYYNLAWPLWIILLLISLGTVFSSYIMSLHILNQIDKKQITVYLGISCLITIEVFLSMLAWPIDPKNKSMLIVAVFYLFWGVISESAQGLPKFKTVAPYLLVTITAIIGIITTAVWYGF